jgi:hypothetical protein
MAVVLHAVGTVGERRFVMSSSVVNKRKERVRDDVF